jgi:hypothetical protein
MGPVDIGRWDEQIGRESEQLRSQAVSIYRVESDVVRVGGSAADVDVSDAVAPDCAGEM